MFKKVLSVLGLVILVSGCQSTLMEPSTEQVETNSKSGNAKMVFIRSAFVGQAIQASVFDVTNNETKFIGIISNDTKVSFDVTPGEHMFMVVGESADFLKANVIADKTYYAVVTPRMGFWKARFSMFPVRNDQSSKFQYDSKDFKEMQKDAKFVKSGIKAEQWAVKNSPSIAKKLAKYLPEWKAKALTKQQAATVEVIDHL